MKPITLIIEDFARALYEETTHAPARIDVPRPVFERLLVEAGRAEAPPSWTLRFETGHGPLDVVAWDPRPAYWPPKVEAREPKP